MSLKHLLTIYSKCIQANSTQTLLKISSKCTENVLKHTHNAKYFIVLIQNLKIPKNVSFLSIFLFGEIDLTSELTKNRFETKIILRFQLNWNVFDKKSSMQNRTKNSNFEAALRKLVDTHIHTHTKSGLN